MNNSESPSPLEEKWTAFMDGRLADSDAAAFAREHPEAAAEREMHLKLAQAMRIHLPAPDLRNAEFFNERILREISPLSAHQPAKENRLWSLWRLATAGAACLLAVGMTYGIFVRGHERPQDHYIAQVLSVKAGDSLLDATVLDADGLAVVWIDGLDQLSSDYVLQ
jgi:hypothetical protein